MSRNSNLSVAVTGTRTWPRYHIVNEDQHFWDNEAKRWTEEAEHATTFANMYTLKAVVSEIEERNHNQKQARYYEATCLVNVRCSDEYSDEDLQFHLAKCINLRVTRGQPDETDSIQDAWIGVSLPWGTLDEISEQEYEDQE